MIPQDFLEAIAKNHRVSKTELQALSLAMGGQSTRAIALELKISEDAVRKRLSEIYQKFHIAGKGPVKLAQLQQLLVNRYQEYQNQTNAGGLGHLINSENEKAYPRQDWGEAPDLDTFYGRINELATLEQLIIQDNCRLISLLGTGGIGKTTFCVKLAKKIQNKFEYIFWRSLYNAPPLTELLNDLLKFLFNSLDPALTEDVDENILRLTNYLQKHRCLLILDDVENILRSGDVYGRYRPDRNDYGLFFKRLAEKRHQSCFIVISREKLTDISLMENPTGVVRSYELMGLKPEEAKEILEENELTGKPQWAELIRLYRGNPADLKLIVSTIKEIFNSNVAEFMNLGTIVINYVRLEKDFGRLSEKEKQVMYHLASSDQTFSFQDLSHQIEKISASDLIEILESLTRRSLINKNQKPNTSESLFTIQPVIRKYITKFQANDQ